MTRNQMATVKRSTCRNRLSEPDGYKYLAFKYEFCILAQIYEYNKTYPKSM